MISLSPETHPAHSRRAVAAHRLTTGLDHLLRDFDFRCPVGLTTSFCVVWCHLYNSLISCICLDLQRRGGLFGQHAGFQACCGSPAPGLVSDHRQRESEMARKAKRAAAAKTKPKVKGSSKAKPGAKPIELYYWPTPNGFKIIDHAGGVRAPLHADPGEHRQGRAVQARLPENLAQQPDAGDRRSRRAGRPADLGLRVRRDPAISRAQDRQVLSDR